MLASAERDERERTQWLAVPIDQFLGAQPSSDS
jgi:hypothetical protein